MNEHAPASNSIAHKFVDTMHDSPPIPAFVITTTRVPHFFQLATPIRDGQHQLLDVDPSQHGDIVPLQHQAWCRMYCRRKRHAEASVVDITESPILCKVQLRRQTHQHITSLRLTAQSVATIWDAMGRNFGEAYVKRVRGIMATPCPRSEKARWDDCVERMRAAEALVVLASDDEDEDDEEEDEDENEDEDGGDSTSDTSDDDSTSSDSSAP